MPRRTPAPAGITRTSRTAKGDMSMRIASALRSIGLCTALAALAASPSPRADAQAWDAVKYFQYNIENVTVMPDVVVRGAYKVRVIFSVTDPVNGGVAWNIKTAPPFQFTGV